MFLESLKLTGFRSCDRVTVSLRPDLTVLVGENNGGKSNIIDGIRLLTAPLSGRRDRYAEEDDIRRGSTRKQFELEGRFCGLSETVKGLLISAVPDPNEDLAIIGMRYEARSSSQSRGRTSFWGGKFDTAEPESGVLEVVRHVILPALRDARHTLGSSGGTRIASLIDRFLAPEEEGDFLRHVKRDEQPHRVIDSVNTEIRAALGALTRGVRPQDASLNFTAESVADVARDLRFRLADAGIPLEDIRSSGLGYSNLLYIATVVVELAKAKEADLTLFLVEEPEAHLHPQLQMLVLDFLLEASKASAAQPMVAGQPEGRVQVVVSTHSPNLTSWVSPEHLVVVRTATETVADQSVNHTVAIPIAGLGLPVEAREKIRRYLDVTRSAILFGNRVLLVEGMAEAILLPVLARRVVLAGDSEAFQRFRGAVLVPIDGVDFQPYVEMLLKPCGGATVAERVIIITDADPQVPGSRKADMEELAAGFGSTAKLSVFTNSITLEHELFLAGNASALKRAFVSLHPRSITDWEAALEVQSADPEALVALFERKRVRKGDFAQRVAALVEAGEPFKVPQYLDDAIRKASEF